MSKIGRRPIEIGDVKVEVKGRQVHYAGKHATGVYEVPALLSVSLQGESLLIGPSEVRTSDTNRLWGLHRALLNNKIIGAGTGFQKQLTIVGLGYKGVKKASGIEFSLGYSHKIDFPVPAGVTVEIDKSGQNLTLWSVDKELLGLVCSKIRALRPPEPYKGTGIRFTGEEIRRKAGKAKV
ncbi:MAG: 50S ribosomal protein L6 [Candidatus Babeliaceae bacterium]|nr:50S ribosomal protein L6 [Candidatus Babeliaceae bacterium]